MNKICEMLVSDYFKLSIGHTVIVGTIKPDLDNILGKCKADLYIGDKKQATIDILGEDQLNRVNEDIRRNRKVVRTMDDVSDDLKSVGSEKVILVFFA